MRCGMTDGGLENLPDNVLGTIEIGLEILLCDVVVMALFGSCGDGGVGCG